MIPSFSHHICFQMFDSTTENKEKHLIMYLILREQKERTIEECPKLFALVIVHILTPFWRRTTRLK